MKKKYQKYLTDDYLIFYGYNATHQTTYGESLVRVFKDEFYIKIIKTLEIIEEDLDCLHYLKDMYEEDM